LSSPVSAQSNVGGRPRGGPMWSRAAGRSLDPFHGSSPVEIAMRVNG
jgi:hypothetical protein